MQKIIDFHCHIFPETIAEKARKNTLAFYGVSSQECFGTPEDLMLRCDETGIEACVVHGVATRPEQVASVNRFLSRSAARYPGKLIPFGTVHPDSPDSIRVIDELCAQGFQGIKLHPDIQGFALNSPGCMAVLEACRGRLKVLFHAGDPRYAYSNPNQIVPVLEAFPDITFIGAHLGGYLVWEEAVQKLAGRYDNFYVDCCSSSFAMTKESFRGYIEAFGTKRVLFGSDYPMWNPAKELETLQGIGLSESELSDILYSNAASLLK